MLYASPDMQMLDSKHVAGLYLFHKKRDYLNECTYKDIVVKTVAYPRVMQFEYVKRYQPCRLSHAKRILGKDWRDLRKVLLPGYDRIRYSPVLNVPPGA